MLVAYHFASAVLPRHSSRFSRHDFTLAQLFACLVLLEHQRKSYRGIEALLKDAEHWCKAIGMRRVMRPQHAVPGDEGDREALPRGSTA